jgi:predicted aminopeptidase
MPELDTYSLPEMRGAENHAGAEQEPIKAILAGGNLRSLERTEEVVALVLGNRTRLHELYACLLEDDETDAGKRCTRESLFSHSKV